MTTLPMSPALLMLPHLRIQNANAISSPMTHGFPSMTAFLGLMWSLERKIAGLDLEITFDSVGVICHAFDEQTTEGGYTKAFRLTRNPVNEHGATAAIVEEGRIHLDITLVFGVNGGFMQRDEARHQAIADAIGNIVAGMRVAGGSVLPSQRPLSQSRPMLKVWSQATDDAAQQFRQLRRRWLPGFALVCRDDLLQQRVAKLQAQNPEATALDAWLDLSRFNWRPVHVDEQEAAGPEVKPKVEWKHDRTEGWIVPIPVGYGALSEVHPAGSVLNARDQSSDFRFVESLYSVGQWIGPHRLNHVCELLWYSQTDVDNGLYRCRNDFSSSALAHHD